MQLRRKPHAQPDNVIYCKYCARDGEGS